jgi:hypothetical protein
MTESITQIAAEKNAHAICRLANRLDTPDAYLAAIAALSAIGGTPSFLMIDDGISIHTVTTLWEVGYDPDEIPALIAMDETISIDATPSIAVAQLLYWFHPEAGA